jgi:hypothetical protein
MFRPGIPRLASKGLGLGQSGPAEIKPLFTATATGRHTESSDAMIKADLSVPQAMGGPALPSFIPPGPV